MARHIKRTALFLLAAGLIVPAIQRDSPSPFAKDVMHGRISIHHNDDGTVKLGPRNEAETSNWSGYIVSNFVTGDTYSSANASWIVPSVSYKDPTPTCHVTQNWRSARQVCFSVGLDTEYSSSWVGIGGSCENANCTRSDNSLIQLGTEQDAAEDGTTQYYAWYELLPRGPVVMSPQHCRDMSCAYPVHPGDAIAASLACQTNCEPGESQSWLLTLTDSTQKWTFTTTVTYKSTLASSEWIQEAPSSSAGVLPLADFANTPFDPTDNSANPGIVNLASGGVGPDGLLLVDPYGETSAPSPVARLDAFSTCWGNNPKSVAACPAPQ